MPLKINGFKNEKVNKYKLSYIGKNIKSQKTFWFIYYLIIRLCITFFFIIFKVKFSKNFYFLAGLMFLHLVSFLISLIAVVSMSIYAISFIDNCDQISSLTLSLICSSTSSKQSSKKLFWAMMSFGIVSTLLSAAFLAGFAKTVNRAYSKWSTKS